MDLRSAWKLLCAAFLVTHFACLISCANMGNPDGGWYDDTPPRVVSSSPDDKSVNVKAKKIYIQFNEFIKIEDVQNKVIVSPPQMEQAEIKAAGKRIIVELKDTLKENTTYTVDFSDAISDNNEGNPMGNYTYSFSTGGEIDTFEVSGYVLDAQNLEPVKGILVGLYSDFSDSIFRKKPMARISRTDSRGHFTVKGVAPGSYRCYALQDADGDFVYNQKSEMVAFNHETYVPSSRPDVRQDTVWLDTLHIDRLLQIPYTHFLPDDITLMAFTAVQDDRFLLKTERKDPEKMCFYFSYGNPELPQITGLNFDAENLLADANEKQDTIVYWLRDTALINQDTLRYEIKYLKTDSTGVLAYQVDTLEAVPKISYAKRMKEQEKEDEKWQKEQEKLKKRGELYDSIRPKETTFDLQLSATSIAPDQKLYLNVPIPLARFNKDGIQLYSKRDSLWYRTNHLIRPVKGKICQYEVLAQWEPGVEYSLEADSAACETIYGLVSKKVKLGIKVGELDQFSTLSVTLSGVTDTCYVVQLVNQSEAVVKQVRAKDMVADFYYVKPGTYYLRAFHDPNGNNQWDTGDYDADYPAEDVYYFHDEVECKEKWDINRSWNLTARRRFEQKPDKLKKQKGDQQKKLQNRNAQRAKQLGIEYVQKKTGVKM